MPAWPFSTITAPTLDSGFVAVPTGVQALVPGVAAVSTPGFVLGAQMANPTLDEISVQLVDGSGNVIVPNTAIPSGAFVPFHFGEFMPFTGLQWLATGAGLIGKVWGWV